MATKNYEDLDYFHENLNFLAGTDEVGRGPLAGPVVAACVLWENQENGKRELKRLADFLRQSGVTDSKKLTPKKRFELIQNLGLASFVENSSFHDRSRPIGQGYEKKISLYLEEKYFLKIGLAEISPLEIDQMNILNASLKAMKMAFNQTLPRKLVAKKKSISGCFNEEYDYGHLLVDGHKKMELNDHFRVKQYPLVKGDSRSVLIGLASIVAKEYRDRLMTHWSCIYPAYGFEKHSGYPTLNHRKAIATYGITPLHRKTFGIVKEFVHE